MKKHRLSGTVLERFRRYLISEEKSSATVQKYCHDAALFYQKVGKQPVTKEAVIAYKNDLKSGEYATRSVNSIIASLNSLFSFLGWPEYRIRTIKVQQKAFCAEEKELSKPEYEKLVRTARECHEDRLGLIIETICGTGIRISELSSFTVEAVRKGEVTVSCKGKTRTVFIVKELQKRLLAYARENRIQSGTVFITRTGKPVSRTNVWRDMKILCKKAGVNPSKVFPHNLRHLFARVFYSIHKDLAKLADILGHSNINTTRIYIVSSGIEHRRYLESMRLII